MNILQDELRLIAVCILAQVRRKGVSRVYAKPSGRLSIYTVNDARNTRNADAFLVGTYNSHAAESDIAEDLRERRREIAA